MSRHIRLLLPSLALSLAALLLCSAAARAQCFCEPDYSSPGAPRPAYGPSYCCERGTLMQWSYGTSFDGGPAGYDEPLVTDRPDFTEASTTVGRGVAQMEIGYTFTEDNDTNTRSHSGPEMLWRIGVLADWLEFRIAWNYAEETTGIAGAGRTTVTGAEDLYLGFKIALTPQECLLPETALIPQMLVPTGSAPFNNGEVLPGLNYIYAWELNDAWVTAGSSQFNKAIDGGSGDSYVEFAQSWTVGHSFTDTIGGYAEWFALVPSGADTEQTEHYLNGGFTYLVNNNLQLDVRAGVGLSEASDDYFAGVGLSQRF